MALEGTYNYRRLFKEVCGDKEMAIAWCFTVGLLPSSKLCPSCRRSMSISPSSRALAGYDTCIGLDFRCTKKGCGKKKSVCNNSWFERCNLSVDKVLILAYEFAVRKGTYEDAINESSTDVKTSPETIADRYSFSREVCFVQLDMMFGARGKLGGEGSVLEIDEMKFGKRKGNVGRVREGSWLLGIIDIHTNEFRIEICPHNRRDAVTLSELIGKHILRGSTIMTDCWGGYTNLNSEGYNHLTVNHSYNFVDPDTWANTQKIESQWRPLRKRLSRGGVPQEDLADHVCEFLWRRYVKINNLDPFISFIQAVKLVYDGN